MRRAPWLLPLMCALAGCHSSSVSQLGDSEFSSSAPAGMGSGGASGLGATSGAAGGAAGSVPTNGAGSGATTQPTRTVQETDLYRLEGTRLYYLNGYRGLMVFDVSNVDQPKLLGRSPIFGSPVDMVVENGIATVVVGDWYGQMDDGSPFHGSIVRGLDATDPTNIKVVGEARLGGWVQDDRVVGHVLYAVSVDYGWSYGWGVADGYQAPQGVIVSSVDFGNGAVTAVGKVTFPGYTGIFNVTPNSILLAHDLAGSGQSELRYLDISDPNGAIVQRGAVQVNGSLEGWGADNGRWNLDFADGKTAHAVTCNGSQGWCDGSGSNLATADFSNPDAPVVQSQLSIDGGWSPAVRFDGTRLYITPSNDYGGTTTPLQVYDLSNPAAPVLAGSTTLPCYVWNLLPGPNSTLFAIGQGQSSGGSEDVALLYADVSNPAAPTLLSTATFGGGWAWTPAAGTFKAFTMDATQGLVVLPFSGWDDTSQAYNNGLQLIEFTPTSATAVGAAHTKGWVERGIFVGSRLVSLSDLSLAVIDYSNHAAPAVTAELTLARNVVAAQPAGDHVAEVDSDWWDNDVTTSHVRLLPAGDADELIDQPNAPSVDVEGIDARVFTNSGNPALVYVVTDVRTPAPCDGYSGTCYSRAQQVQVVDLSGGTVTKRGQLRLPLDAWNGYGWGWYGCFWYDWYYGDEVVQFAPDGLAFRRFVPEYNGNDYWLDDKSDLYVVDLSDPDHPSLASTAVTRDKNGWWGNMKVVGSTLYTSHYEWLGVDGNAPARVRYYLDRIDLSDRSQPRIEARVNVPGLLVGGDANDPSILYTIDYRWDADNQWDRDDFDVLKVSGNKATLVGRSELTGWPGQIFVQGSTAYLASQRYDYASGDGSLELHAIDVSKPSHPVDRVASGPAGWGWLVGVVGVRAVVQSGWGSDGADVYQLPADSAPVYKQFVRLRGWSLNGLARQGNQLYLSSGYWGVQSVTLQ